MLSKMVTPWEALVRERDKLVRERYKDGLQRLRPDAGGNAADHVIGIIWWMSLQAGRVS